MSTSPPSVSDMVEALCLFDEPMLNSRYHALLTRRGIQGSGAELAQLPSLALECARLARDGAAEWDRNTTAVAASESFFTWAEHTDPDGDFRGQLDGAVHAAKSSGSGVRHIVLSPTGLRHLRDQGCFRDGSVDYAGYPVSVDMGWDAPAFVIETYERVTLDEIAREGAADDGDFAAMVRGDAAPSQG